MTPEQRKLVERMMSPAFITDDGIDALRACLAQADRCAEVEQKLDRAMLVAEREIAYAIVRFNARASRVCWIDSVTGEACESAQSAPLDDIVYANATATALRMLAFETMRSERDEARTALAASERDAALGRKLRAWRCPNCAEPIGYAKLCEMCADCFAVEAIAATRAESTKPEGCE